MGPRFTFAGTCALTNLCFAANVAFAAIVGRLHFRSLHENEQAFQVRGQLPLQKNECFFMFGRHILDDGFFAARAERLNTSLEFSRLFFTSHAPGAILLQSFGVVVDHTQLIEKRRLFVLVGMLQSELDRFANQMRPAKLVLAEQALVSRIVVGDADASEGVA